MVSGIVCAERVTTQIPLPDGLSVAWDRGVDLGDELVGVYGWIERQDGRGRDFLYVDISKETGQVKWYMTSSAKWSARLNEIYFPGTEHNPCLLFGDALALVEMAKR